MSSDENQPQPADAPKGYRWWQWLLGFFFLPVLILMIIGVSNQRLRPKLSYGRIWIFSSVPLFVLLVCVGILADEPDASRTQSQAVTTPVAPTAIPTQVSAPVPTLKANSPQTPTPYEELEAMFMVSDGLLTHYAKEQGYMPNDDDFRHVCDKVGSDVLVEFAEAQIDAVAELLAEHSSVEEAGRASIEIAIRSGVEGGGTARQMIAVLFLGHIGSLSGESMIDVYCDR